MGKKVVVIGAGFSGLSTACYLAQAGFDVTVLEKNARAGGRAMVMKSHGFTFDLGPSWYMMPDVFEEFFADFDRTPDDYYELVQLDPSYRVYTEKNRYDITTAPHVFRLFEQVQPGSSVGLERLLKKTAKEYAMVRKDLLSKPMLNALGAVNPSALKLLLNPSLLGNYDARIRRFVDHPELTKILEFMVVFMGGSPKNIPALYSLLTHVDMGQGIWYPQGGFGRVVDALLDLAHELGVQLRYNHEVTRIVTTFREVNGVETAHGVIKCDAVVAAADYRHVETQLLDDRQRSYSDRYWKRRTVSPSGLLGYIGVDRPVSGLLHHNLFLDTDWDQHFNQVFDQKVWSDEPLFYVCAPSKTDPSVAPKGKENLFILAPMAAGEQPSRDVLETTMDRVLRRIEQKTGASIRRHVIFRDVRAQNYFTETFNAYRGNAFGLAHTLRQSAFLRPRLKSRSIEGLYYAGQFTNPGTGVPIAILSGKVVSSLIKETWAKK